MELTFKGKGVQYWRARLDDNRVKTFSDAVRWFEREHGLSRANAINAARRMRPDLYNEWWRGGGKHHLPMQQSSSSGSGRPAVQVMSLRTHTGAPLVNFRGL